MFSVLNCVNRLLGLVLLFINSVGLLDVFTWFLFICTSLLVAFCFIIWLVAFRTLGFHWCCVPVLAA